MGMEEQTSKELLHYEIKENTEKDCLKTLFSEL